MDETENIEKLEQLINYHYFNSKNYENVCKYCLEALEYDPHNGSVLATLTHAYFEVLNFDNEREFALFIETAEKALMHLKPAARSRAVVLNLLGIGYRRRDSYDKAAEYFKQAVETKSHSGEFLGNYAEAIAHLGRVDEAETLLNRAEELSPQDYYTLQAKSNFLEEFRRDRKAEEETLSRLLPLSTDPQRTYYRIARFHRKYGEFQEAYDYYVKALLVNPKNDDILEKLRELEDMGYGKREQ